MEDKDEFTDVLLSVVPEELETTQIDFIQSAMAVGSEYLLFEVLLLDADSTSTLKISALLTLPPLSERQFVRNTSLALLFCGATAS